MRMRWSGLLLMVFLAAPVVLTAAPATAQTAAPYIAGTEPSVRPAGAPTITEFKPDAAWMARAFTGVSEPYPPSLGFMKDQGAWFTPFIHPGLVDQYDIRGWHTRYGDAAIEALK